MKPFLIICTLCILFLSKGFATPYAIQDRTIAKLDRFEKALDWLVTHRKQLTEEQSKTLEELGLLDEVSNANEIIEQEMIKAQEAFRQLRQHIYQIVLAANVSNHEVKELIIQSQAELVNWYTAYMENIVFPENWETCFQAYLDKKDR